MAGLLALAALLGPPSAGAVRLQAAPDDGAGRQQASAAARPQAAQPKPQTGGAPSDVALGVPVFLGAQFLASYDAGRGQRFYLYGTTATFAEVVAYYKTILKQKGEQVFDDPAVYVFDVGRFREDTMAFPPGITIKDYSTGPSQGYLNPTPGGQPARFPTILQIVTPPPASPGPPKH